MLAAARYLASMPLAIACCSPAFAGRDGRTSVVYPAQRVRLARLARRLLPGVSGGRPAAQRRPAQRLTNIVVMGMGEPFANYERVWQALQTITDKDGFGLGARHITVSTVGLPQGIRKMAAEPLQVNLAVSLHAPNDELRGAPAAHQPALSDSRRDGRDRRVHPADQSPCHVRVRDDGRHQRHARTRRRACSPAQAAPQPDRRRHVSRQPDPAEPGRRVALSAVDRRRTRSPSSESWSATASPPPSACAGASTSTQAAANCAGGWPG